MFLPSKPVLPRLLDGLEQALARDRVLVPDVDEALLAADGARADDHPLDDRVRIALDDAAVHERAGIALVGVADDNRFHAPVLGGVPAGFPLDAGSEIRRRRGRAAPIS